MAESQKDKEDGTWSRHGVSTAPGATITATVRLFLAATAATNASSFQSKERLARSPPSLDVVATNTRATSAAAAAAAAAAASLPST